MYVFKHELIIFYIILHLLSLKNITYEQHKKYMKDFIISTLVKLAHFCLKDQQQVVALGALLYQKNNSQKEV